MKISHVARVQKRDTCAGNLSWSWDRLSGGPPDNRIKSVKATQVTGPAGSVLEVHATDMIKDGGELQVNSHPLILKQTNKHGGQNIKCLVGNYIVHKVSM